jgi:cytoskeleton protein RodZ
MNHDESLPLNAQGNEETPDNDEVPADTVASMQPEDPAPVGAVPDTTPTGPTLGERLRASRERHGMSLQDCAQALRLPTRVLRKLEADDYAGIDYSVYLRGYLRTYAEHVRLDRVHVEALLDTLDTRQPELVAGPSIPAWKRIIERYSSSATYIVLTAVIVVPLIWFGLNGMLKRDMARLAPLNATPVGTPSDAGGAGHASNTAVASRDAGNADAAVGRDGAQSPAQSQKPLMASMAPFSAMQSPLQPETELAKPTKQATPAPAATGTRLSVSLQQPSLEYALLPAGTHRDYRSDQPFNVRIGNAEGAQVDVDGKPIALDRFQHGKVAHFNVTGDGTIRPDNS